MGSRISVFGSDHSEAYDVDLIIWNLHNGYNITLLSQTNGARMRLQVLIRAYNPNSSPN